MGSYLVGLSSAIVAVATYAHRANCRCWRRAHDSLEAGISSGEYHPIPQLLEMNSRIV
ncbi:hypothetical protein F5Y04DRAFT_242497 [Hypomontagnella monticulosa]|nr:hypothetical protein F5Y04DRAFT_242497 [Hypomontagnella monticulosa]